MPKGGKGAKKAGALPPPEQQRQAADAAHGRQGVGHPPGDGGGAPQVEGHQVQLEQPLVPDMVFLIIMPPPPIIPREAKNRSPS